MTTNETSPFGSECNAGLGPLPIWPHDHPDPHTMVWTELELRAIRAYAALCMAAERERCAKLCDDISDEYQRTEGRRYPELKSDAQEGAAACADRIRAGA